MDDVASRPGGLRTRLAALPGVKAAWLVGMALFICIPYFALQSGPFHPVRQPPVLWIDRAIPFDPRWLGPYLSIVVLVPLFPLLARRRDEVARYVRGVVLLSLPCFLCFYLWPVAGPRPEQVAGPLHSWLVGVDRVWNSMPSLHAGLATYSALYGMALLGTGRSRRLLAFGLTAWVVAILYSTLATKQHWFLDLPPAVGLACLAHYLVRVRDAGSSS